MYKIGIDIGGTFTDCVIFRNEKRIVICKSPTVADDPSAGVLAALADGCRLMKCSLQEVLARCEIFIHGCTIATNAIIERSGVNTAFVTTRGHEDTLLMGKMTQKVAGLSELEITHTSNLSNAEPPLVPRNLTFGITERVIWNGRVLIPLKSEEMDHIIDRIAAMGVQSVAVCLLWSFMNPTHEREIKRILAEKLPHIYCSISSEISPTFGEYERAAATVINAYVGPKIRSYLQDLQARLKANGYARPLLAMQCDGGSSFAADAARQAVLMIDSGPVGGVAGGRWLGFKYNEPNLICTDVGGTSFDVGLIFGHELQRENEPVISKYQFRIPRVEIKSIGAGGGSIAWIDVAGILQVGPQSAGANPGPACYNRGGHLPTVTDADLILGYLNPEYFLGGALPLSRKKAEAALRPLSAGLSKDVQETAHAIFKIMNARMADLIRKCTVQRGFDPRDFSLVAYGGAGPTHAAFYGADVNARSIYVLPNATVFSAFGMLTSPITYYAMASRRMASPYSREDCRHLDGLIKSLNLQVLSKFRDVGIRAQDVEIAVSLSMRYKMQAYAVEVAIDNTSITPGRLNNYIIPAFEKKYAEIYGTGTEAREAGTEIITCRVTGKYARFALKETAPMLSRSTSRKTSALKGKRVAFFEQGGRLTGMDTALYDGERLPAGSLIAGPAIVERYGDAVVIPPGFGGKVDDWGTIILAREIEQLH